MPEMPEILEKEYGPFSGLEWTVIIVGGVGLGLALRYYLNRRGGDQSAAPGSTGVTSPDYGVSTGAMPSSGGPGSGSLYNQGEIVSAVLEDIKTQQPPPAATTPEVETDPDPEPDPEPLPEAKPKPKPKPKPAPKADPLEPYRQAVYSAYQLEGVDPPGASSVNRIAISLKNGNRSTSDLRQSIRNNERKQGRLTAADSRAYWSGKTDKAGSPGV